MDVPIINKEPEFYNNEAIKQDTLVVNIIIQLAQVVRMLIQMALLVCLMILLVIYTLQLSGAKPSSIQNESYWSHAVSVSTKQLHIQALSFCNKKNQQQSRRKLINGLKTKFRFKYQPHSVVEN